MFEREIKRLKSHMDGELWEMFGKLGCFVAGGAITSLFTKREVNDLDIYFPSKEAMVVALANIFGDAEDSDTGIDGEYFFDLEFAKLYCVQVTEKSIMFGNTYRKEHPVQFIYFNFFETPEEIFDTFDFTCCMGAYDIAKDEMVLHPQFLAHNAQRHLQFNPKTAFPLMSMLRVRKYQEKGYTISKSQFIRIVMQCMNTEIKSWEDLEEHIGGMYGEDVSEIFDKDKPFNLSEAIEQLDNLEGNLNYFNQLLPWEVTSHTVDINRIYEDLLAKQTWTNNPECISDIDYAKVDYTGRYFKWVRADLTSHFNGNFKYSVGEYVDGGKRGVYCFQYNDSLTPTYHNGKLIELEGGFPTVEDRTGKRTILGEVLVKRVVPKQEAMYIDAEYSVCHDEKLNMINQMIPKDSKFRIKDEY